MQFPIIYVDFDYSEHDLFEITYDDWYHDVDAQHTIGPFHSNNQFVLDKNGELYRIFFTGMDKSNVPTYRFEPCDEVAALNKIRKYISERS